MQIINFQQGTQEWLDARLGVITASKFGAATAKLKSGAAAAVATDYAQQLAYERALLAPADIVVSNAAMRRGSELEPAARRWYESQTGEIVEQTGLILSDCGTFGYSPDGLVGEDGALEIKCPLGKQFLAAITAEDWSDYLHQVQGGLWLTGRKWCDLIIYTDGGGGRGYIARIMRDEAFIAKLAEDLAAFNSIIEELKTKLINKIGA